MHAPSSRIRRLLAFAVAPVSVLAAAGMVWQSSYAAFTSETRSAGNAWSTGTVTLNDDDAGTARFTVENMVPGQTQTKCIKVTSTSSVPGVVKAYMVNPTHSAANLEDHIIFSMESGNGGNFGSCTGFVPDVVEVTNLSLETAMTTITNYATGVAPWTTAGVSSGESKTYRITWTFDTTGLTQSALDGLQGARTGVDFEWELQNT